MADRERRPFAGSSWVSAAYYDAELEIIEVVFVDGVRWNFYRCKPATWAHFKTSGSAGQFVREILERHPNSAA